MRELKYVVTRQSNSRKREAVFSAHYNYDDAHSSMVEAIASEDLRLQAYWINYRIREVI